MYIMETQRNKDNYVIIVSRNYDLI